MKRTIFFALAFLLLPQAASAQGTLHNLISEFQKLIEASIPVILTLAAVGVLWGLARYAFKSGDEKAQEEGRRIMVWGVITLFVMFSIWGIVAILQTAFGTAGITSPGPLPTLNEVPAPGGNGGGGGEGRIPCNSTPECNMQGFNSCSNGFCVN